MVNYHCPRCGYETTHFVTFKRHLSRKKICVNILSDDNLHEEYIKYNIKEKLKNVQKISKPLETFQMTHFLHKMTENDPKMTHNDPEFTEKKKFQCEHCKKFLSKSCHLSRHLSTCKVKQEKDKEKSEMSKVIDLLNQQLLDKDKKIDELIKKSGTTNITYNQQNNVSNNIKLLGYRNTDISHLSDKDFISCISHSNFCIPHLIKKIHFDPDKPENHNIYISNIKNNYAMIYDGDKWNLTNKDDLINEILEEKEIIIEEKLEQWLEKGRQYPEIMKKFTRYLEKKENDVVLDKIKDEVKLVLFNNRNLVKN